MSQADINHTRHQDHLSAYQLQENIAHDTVSALHQLYRDQDVKVALYGTILNGMSATEIVTEIQKASTKSQQEKISLQALLDLTQQLKDKNITTAVVDAGQLLSRSVNLDEAISKANTTLPPNSVATDVVLYGFGRIGRILTRLLMSQAVSDKGLQLKGIVVRPGAEGDIAKRASLLERDSVHGKFSGSIQVDEAGKGIVINGRYVQIIYANDPSDIDYTSYGIDNAIVIDNTGIWKDEEGLSKHLQSKGVQKVLLTAPAKGSVKNVVFNVNNDMIGDDKIVSAASCTTNAITPSLKVLNDKYGIKNGHVETIHAFTNDQNLIDNHHKSDRRGRSAVLNMVITSTGAAKAVGKALPELDGKLTGNAIRVPTPNVSLAILNLNLAHAPQNADELNQFFKEVSLSGQWQEQIAYSDSPEAVSTDFVGEQIVGIVDAKATIVTGNHATVYIWYDNEVGYSTQVLRVASQMAGIYYTHISA